jgi:hypothetical protein
MKIWATSLAGLWALFVLAATPAHARAPMGPACCQVPAGSMVEVQLVEPVSTKHQKRGDTFALRLAAPLIVDGRILLRAGTPGWGEVIESAKPGLGGKAAKLVLAARYLRLRHGRVPLKGLQLAAAGHNNANTANVVGLTGIAFAPLGFVGLAVKGGHVTFPPGTSATARVASDIFLPSLGRAPRGAAEASAALADDAGVVAGAIEIPPPPAGKGQVVFFRRKSLLGAGQWFNVRENGAALGKLTNGAYFVQVTDPGLHTYTATTEPELKDHLRLEVDAGETYFVEGALTKGVVIGTANIFPSGRDAFVSASKHLKLAPPPAQAKADDELREPGSDVAGETSAGAAEAPPR